MHSSGSRTLDPDKFHSAGGTALDGNGGLRASKAIRDQGEQLPVGLAIHRRRLKPRLPQAALQFLQHAAARVWLHFDRNRSSDAHPDINPVGLANGRGLAEFLRQILKVFVHVFRLAEDPRHKTEERILEFGDLGEDDR